MPNKNYLRGRRLEYEVCKLYREAGWEAVRTAGSHGWCDVIARTLSEVRPFRSPFVEKGWEVERRVSETDPWWFLKFTRGKDTVYIWVSEGLDYCYHHIQCKRGKHARLNGSPRKGN